MTALVLRFEHSRIVNADIGSLVIPELQAT